MSTNYKRKNLSTEEKDAKSKKIHHDDELDKKKKKKNNLDILKRGRTFVDKDTMMNLIDQLNEKEDERIEKKLQRQNNLEQIIEGRHIKQQRNQSIRKEKIEKVKKSIKNKKRKKSGEVINTLKCVPIENKMDKKS